MSNDDRSVNPHSLLLSQDAQRLLREHGLTCEITLRDARGAAPSAAELTRLCDELRECESQSEHAQQLATVGGLAAGVTHEARNLLTGVLGFAQVLLARTSEADASYEKLRAIERETRRCVELLSNYLKLSRASETALQALNVSDIVVPVEQLVAHPLQQRGCNLSVELPEALPVTQGRVAELQRVLVNLIFNAADAAGCNGQIALAVSALSDGGVEISVADNGPGVPPGLRTRVFQPFFSTKRGAGGTGLGLALSRLIVEAHGGTLELDANYTPGARFTVRLPPAAQLKTGSTSEP